MNTYVHTNVACDAVSVRRASRFRDSRSSEIVAPQSESMPADSMLSTALAGASPGYFLGTFTLIGSQVAIGNVDGESVVSFFLNCSSTSRVHYPARQVVATRTIGRCGDQDLIELTIARSRNS